MIQIVYNILAFIVAIGILVSVHEFGHFWVARRFGVRVLRFSIGFGRPIWHRVARDGVEYQVAMIPLGGYVKLLDEREGPVAVQDQARAFNRQSPGVRIAVFAAGPGFNFLLAIALFWLMLVVGVPDRKPFISTPPADSRAAVAQLHDHDLILSVDGKSLTTWSELQSVLVDHALSHRTADLVVESPAGTRRPVALDMTGVRVDPQFLFADIGLGPYQPPMPPVLGQIIAGQPAAQSGFEPGDRILEIDGQSIATFQQFQQFVAAHPAQVVKIRFQRDGADIEKSILIGSEKRDGVAYGHFGAAAARMANEDELWQSLRAELRYGPIEAIPQAFSRTWHATKQTAEMFYRMAIGDVSLKNISGPINTAQMAGVSARIGLAAFISLLAVLSINLGIVNLVPIPILDGGQLLLCVVEAVKGAPLSERAQIIGQQLGLVLLGLLLTLACYNDLSRLMS